MLKILKWTGILLAGLLVAGLIAGFIAHQPRPEGEEGPQARKLAEKMLAAVNKDAWDSTRYVRWTFPGGHHYHWDKERELVQVQWADKRVVLHTPSQKGQAWSEGVPLSGTAREATLQKAWNYFCNDSFWLNAPAKALDPGTRRSVVSLPDGGKGLMVEYTSGGVTPGDAYLWLLDDEGLPRAWKMWVGIIPIGGLEASWEGWITLSTGARLATQHNLSVYTSTLENVMGGNVLTDIGLEDDPFSLPELE